MEPSARSQYDAVNLKTLAILGGLYCFTASAITINENVEADYRTFILGALAYIFVEGAHHIREATRIYQSRPDGLRLSHPDFIYHFMKAYAGPLFFGGIFGATELMSLTKSICHALASCFILAVEYNATASRQEA
jgi:hypothetical protein